MKIGELASSTQTPVATIRFYEREGLLSRAPRSEANYRIYGAEQVERLGFIRHCRSLDMTLDEIRALLRLKDTPDEPCGDVNALLDEHIGHVVARIRELKQLESLLKSLRERCCVVQDAGHCGILAELSQAATTARASDRSHEGHVAGSHAARRRG